jgi:hypothetical protein
MTMPITGPCPTGRNSTGREEIFRLFTVAPQKPDCYCRFDSSVIRPGHFFAGIVWTGERIERAWQRSEDAADCRALARLVLQPVIPLSCRGQR